MPYHQYLLTSIKYSFGTPASTILSNLLNQSGLTFTNILTRLQSDYTTSTIQQTLLTLIQHDIIYCTYHSDPKITDVDTSNTYMEPLDKPTGTKKTIYYHIDTDIIQYRTRFGLYIDYIHQQYSNQLMESIVTLVCQHGKLTIQYIIDNVNKQFDTAEPCPSYTAQQISDTINQLIQYQLIHPARTIHNDNELNGGQSNDGEAELIFDNHTIQHHNNTNQSIKKRVPSSIDTNQQHKRLKLHHIDEQPVPSNTAIQTNKHHNSTVTQLYAINHRQFIHIFCRNTIIDYTNQYIGSTAGYIVRAILQSYENSTDNTRRGYDIVYIHNLVLKLSNKLTNNITLNDIKSACHELCNDTLHILQLSNVQAQSVYNINIHALITELQMRHIQSAIRDKYGVLSARIFKLLYHHKSLEESGISDLACCSRKQCRELCHELFKSKYIQLQQVPRTTDKNPSKSFMIWYCNTNTVQSLMCDMLYFTWWNIRTRIQVEYDKVSDIYHKLHKYNKPLSSAEQLLYDKYVHGNQRCYSALQQINKLIMLFNDYNKLQI